MCLAFSDRDLTKITSLKKIPNSFNSALVLARSFLYVMMYTLAGQLWLRIENKCGFSVIVPSKSSPRFKLHHECVKVID